MSTGLVTLNRAIVTAPTQMVSPPATVMPVALAMAREQASEAAPDQVIRLLARSLGRQAARRHLTRGWSIMEVSLALVAAALVLAAALYIRANLGRLS